MAREIEEPINVGKQMIDRAKAASSAPTTPKQRDEWKSVPWQRIEKRVFRLQLRIAKAVG